MRLKKFIENLPVDPKLDENCLILDKDNVTVLGQFGKRTRDRYYCEEDGFRVPIGHELERDRHKTKLCRDTGLKDCLLERHGSRWVPIHRPKLDGKCDLYDTDGTYLGRVGKPTESGEHCRFFGEKRSSYNSSAIYQEQPIGVPFYTDADRSRVCLDVAMKRCFLKAADGRGTLAVEGSERFTSHYLHTLGDKADKKINQVKQTGQDIASGQITISTIGEEARQAAQQAAEAAGEAARNPSKLVHAASARIATLIRAAEEFKNKSFEEKLDLAADVTADLTEKAAMAAGGRVLGVGLGVGRTTEKLAEAAKDVSLVGNRTVSAVKAIENAEHAATNAAHIAKQAGPAVRPGMPFTKGGKKEVWSQNATRHEGLNKCDSCRVEVIKPQKHTKGITPPAHEGHVDHMTAKAKGGSGTPDNGQLLCRDCNLEKSDK